MFNQSKCLTCVNCTKILGSDNQCAASGLVVRTKTKTSCKDYKATANVFEDEKKPSSRKIGKAIYKYACVDVDTNEVLSMHRTARVAERYLSYHRNGIYREYGRRGICSEAEVREIA